MELLTRYALECARAIVGRIHDKRVAFPMADRVSQPRLDVLRRMRTGIHFDDTCVMEHFRHDHDRARRFHDLIVALVSGSQLRRTVCNTPLAQRPVMDAQRMLHSLSWCGTGLDRPGRKGGDAAVRWIYNQRRPILPGPLVIPLGAVIASLTVSACEALLQTEHVV